MGQCSQGKACEKTCSEVSDKSRQKESSIAEIETASLCSCYLRSQYKQHYCQLRSQYKQHYCQLRSQYKQHYCQLDPSTNITTASLDPSTNSTTASSDPSTNTGSSITTGLDYRNKDLDMSQRLELWLAAKGKTPSTVRTAIKHTKECDHPKQEKVKSRRSMPATCTQPIETDEPVVYSKEAEDVDLIDAKHHGKSRVTTLMEDMLTDCLTLLDTDCPVDNMKQWLSDACGRNPRILQCAKYWICKARMAALEGRSQDDIIECYELAVQHGAQPIEEIRSALEEFVGAPSPFWHDGNKPDVALPSSSDTEMDLVSKELSGMGYRELHNNKMETEMSASSSNIRYCVSKTPLFNRIHKVFGENAAITPISIVTPVRRSVRLEQLSATKPPGSFQSHDVCVSSLGELPVEEMDGFIYKPNKTLQAEFDAVMEVDEKLG
ncbi:cytoskeleton-associated protein 2-like [Ptychodera flava]|uniref:cytoskeleton-associated protein 2-like n=1 Tax=Ptychodera flava TaxID=63121 RepID=UPI003969CA8C